MDELFLPPKFRFLGVFAFFGGVVAFVVFVAVLSFFGANFVRENEREKMREAVEMNLRVGSLVEVALAESVAENLEKVADVSTKTAENLAEKVAESVAEKADESAEKTALNVVENVENVENVAQTPKILPKNTPKNLPKRSPKNQPKRTKTTDKSLSTKLSSNSVNANLTSSSQMPVGNNMFVNVKSSDIFYTKVREAILKAHFVPSSLAKSGSVFVEFTLLSDGSLQSARVVSPSPELASRATKSKRAEDYALKTIQKTKFPPHKFNSRLKVELVF